MVRIKEGLSLLLVVSSAAIAGASIWDRRALPIIQGELRLSGPQDVIEVIFDRFGVPHARARSLVDCLFAQGFLTAQDRMVQMELNRRIAGGRVAEIAGKPALPLDRFMRTIGLYRVASEIILKIPGDSREYLEAYAKGVNAYLQGRGKHLPLELLWVSGGRPEAWSAEDSIAAQLLYSWYQDATWTADLMRGRLRRLLGAEEAELLLPSSGRTNLPVIEGEGQGAEWPVIEPPAESDLEYFGYEEMHPAWMVPRLSVRAGGSNGWVVGGEKTARGKPLLCADPHAPHGIPTLFYLCHLSSEDPACDVAGITLPGTPGVIAGRNSNIAWGVSNLGADVTDLYVETFEDESCHRYLLEGSWVESQLLEERIRVFPGQSVSHTVVVTGHGPVIAKNGSKGLALKWTGHDPENDSVAAIVRLGLARDWEGFLRAQEDYAGPAASIVYADRGGNIGYCAAGRIPVREGHDGSVPVPGDSGEYGWKGYLPASEKPMALNPERGWIATANNQVVKNWQSNLTAMWESSDRQGRIAELLSADEPHDIDGMRRIQADIYDRRGNYFRKEILTAGEVREDVGAREREGMEVLRDWSGLAEEESVAQALYFLSWRVLTERLLRHRLGHGLYFEYLTAFPNINDAVERILRERRPEWLPPSASNYDELLLQCLKEGMIRLEERFRSPRLTKWIWGDIHRLEIRHFLGAVKPLGWFLNIGPIKLGGDAETVYCSIPESYPGVQLRARSSTGGPSNMILIPKFYSDRAYAGSVFRMIIDFSNNGRSLWCLDVGQCSNPLSGFYRNFFPLWRRLEYAPMAFRAEEVDEVKFSSLRMIPVEAK